ncbi:sugar MFS transporter [Sanguibacter sp. HDW7]|uniref:MFS transporter n=1 Tax=Sanguibacter sp. HDW7 TaxID=2714931 RepID=UPI00140B5582|nr:MFS transporter [Sanguibacter sp. HDW7]QIK84621.1 MFS transporter [Sanguibacter sp. HDW7]
MTSLAATPSAPSVGAMRIALLAQFGIFGVVGAQWLARLPSVRATLGLDALELGGLLTIGGLGTLVSVLLTGGLVTRFGARRVLVAGTLTSALGFGLVALGLATSSVVTLVVGLVVNGVSGAFINIPINIAGAAVERRLGRTVLPHFHATFSVGAALGTLIAAGFSWGHVAVEVQISVVLVVATVLRVVTLRAASAATDAVPDDAVPDEAVPDADVPDDASATADAVRAVAGAPAVDDVVTADAADATEAARRTNASTRPASPASRGFRSALGAWTEPRTLLLGLVLLASSLSEGSAGTWLSIAVTDGFAAREAVGAIAYGTFVAAMTIVRFAGTGLVDRFGRVAVVRSSGVSAFVGLALFALAPSLATAWIGIVLWGAGAALVNPVTIAAASDDPLHAASRVSVASSFSTIAMLTAPPVLGALVDGLGARHALGLITIATVLSMSLAGQLRPRPTSAVR